MNTHRISQIVTSSAVVLLLAACASQPAYRPAEGEGGFGYSERQLSEDQYRIHFRARGDNTGRALDYTMLRAAELTLEQQYDWFDVASRDTLVDRETVVPATTALGVRYATVQDCGLLSCSTYYRPVPHYQTSVTLGDRRSEIEVIMEIRMGKGMRPSDQISYDARELYSRLKPEV